MRGEINLRSLQRHPCWRQAAVTVFCSSTAIVIGRRRLAPA